MDGREISAVMSGAARAVYGYMDDMQWVTDPPMGMSETGVDSVDVGEGFALLHLSARLSDTSGLMLRVDGRVLGELEAGFTRYDEISRTIVVRPDAGTLASLASGDASVSVLTDMKFLVAVAGDFYARYGDRARVPDPPSRVPDPVFPGEPTEQQRSAALAVAGSPMSYIWGAPGTGKTQFVLASCIRGCIRAGERVAVFAPTNNSVEQVLRGVLASFGDEAIPGGVVRLGIPTKGFLLEHPEMCEDRQAQNRMAACIESAANLEEVLYERRCDSILPCMERLLSQGPFSCGIRELAEDRPGLRDDISPILGLAALRPSTSSAVDDGASATETLERLRAMLFDRERPAAAISEYYDWSDADISSEIRRLRAEADALRSRTTGARLSGASLVAGTPHQFLSRFRPRGSPEDGRMELAADRIFLDEAGYCGLVQALALFTNGVPVAMFGDHMQLPPVTQIDDTFLAERARSGGALSDAFLWNMDALDCEAALTGTLGDLRVSYIEGSEPTFGITVRRDLTQSRRFGEALGSVLDRYVYGNGMSGSPGTEISIECVDAVCGPRDTRENPAEAAEVAALLRTERPDPGEVCVLSPYTMQCRLLKRRVGRRYADCVMTVHGSQGREWDTVILSVADSGSVNRDVPLRFTSSRTPIGLRVINTAVSRAKRRLVVVCDRAFWSAQEGELIGGLIEAADLARPRRRCPGRPLSA